MPPGSVIVAIDLALRHTGLLAWSPAGFSWSVFSTAAPPVKEGRAPFASTYHAQRCAEELYDWLRDSVLARDDLSLVAVEIATHAKSSGALGAMMLARGAFAGIAGSLRRRGVQVELVVQQHSRAAVIAAGDRPRTVRLKKNATVSEIWEVGRQRAANRALVKASVEARMLVHFPELAGVEASVGAVLKEHVFDAASVMVAVARRPGAERIAGARLSRLLAAQVQTEGVLQ